MATLTYGPIVTNVAGTIGGVTFQRAGNASIARSKPHPTFPSAPAQQARQRDIAQASQLWNAMDAASRLPWENHALTITLTNAQGQTYNPTGQHVFIWWYSVYVRSSWWSGTPATPTAAGLAAARTVTLSYALHTISLDAFVPAFPTTAAAVFSVYAPDCRRAFPRTKVLFTEQWDDSLGTPYGFSTAIDTGLATGGLYRVWVHYRFIDDQARCSILHRAYLDFTAAP